MMIMMSRALLVIPVILFFGIGFAHAESLVDVSVAVLEYDGNSATIETVWNHDETVTKYEMGCVSCMPNISEFTSTDSIMLNNVTSFPNTSNAMLYLITYDSNDEIINAKQILVDLT